MYARKTLMYISAMMAFHKATFKNIDKTVIQQKLSAVASIVIDGLLSRFTETARGSMEYVHYTLPFSSHPDSSSGHRRRLKRKLCF
jgi:hypothetical protein